MSLKLPLVPIAYPFLFGRLYSPSFSSCEGFCVPAFAIAWFPGIPLCQWICEVCKPHFLLSLPNSDKNSVSIFALPCCDATFFFTLGNSYVLSLPFLTHSQSPVHLFSPWVMSLKGEWSRPQMHKTLFLMKLHNSLNIQFTCYHVVDKKNVKLNVQSYFA